MENLSEKQTAWILAGYELFAQEGPNGLKVEVLSRKVNKSKSSFYHHFADLEIFTSFLLAYHLDQSKIIAEKERQCKNVIPELLEVILEHKQDLLFNRQLRINRTNPRFFQCFQEASKEVAEAILGIWAEGLGMTDHSSLALMVLNLSMENFYLQITEETLTYEWLEAYFQQLQAMAHEMNKRSKLDIPIP
ncbi:MAG: TetR/AcrR family transcriptional regulator [Bacteroidota bacterium]